MSTRADKASALLVEVSELEAQIQVLTARRDELKYEAQLLRQPDDHHRQDGIPCTCPEGHFPPDRKAKLQALPHNYMGALQHASECERAKAHSPYQPKQAIIGAYLQREQRPLFDLAKLRDEADERLRAEGVPEDFIQSFRTYQEIRSEIRNLGMKLVRDVIQVQQLPDGAVPIYDKDPESAG